MLVRNGLPRPPHSSLAHGAAGVAYFLLRYAELAGEPRVLAAAADWIAVAEEGLHDSGAFVAQSSRVFPDRRRPPPPCSLVFGEAGVACVAALVASAVADDAGVETALGSFAAAADACPPDALDAVSGAASLLLGSALLVERLAGPPIPTELMERQAARLTGALEERERPGADPLEWLGAAHGWCGLAYAMLRSCQATGAQPSPSLMSLLESLRDARLPSGLWPRRPGQQEVWPGWCHGSAGWAQLWTLAFELLGDEELLKLAEAAATHAVMSEGDEGAGVCCGQAGEAYAALALYRASGEERWLAGAHELAAKAADTPPGEHFPEHSLWRGDLGVALLLTELEDPLRAAMPLVRPLA